MSTYVVLMVEGEPTAINMDRIDRVVHDLKGSTDNLDFYFNRTEKYTVENMTLDDLLHEVIKHEL